MIGKRHKEANKKDLYIRNLKYAQYISTTQYHYTFSILYLSPQIQMDIVY